MVQNSASDKVRLFIALDLPSVNDQGLPIQCTNLQLLIKDSFPDFTPIIMLHSTLVFVGTVSASLIPAIKLSITYAVHQFIATEKGGLMNGIPNLMMQDGAFIFGKNAVAVKLVPNPLLTRLTLYLQAALEKNGLGGDPLMHESMAHITLGRVCPEYVQEVLFKQFIAQLPAPSGARATLNETFTAKSVTLYQSLPESNYVALQTYKI